MVFNPLKKNNVTILNGKNKDKTMVFAHGFGTDQTSWKQVASAFEDEYRIVLYDNVGAGLADPEAFSPNKYDTLQSYADDLVDICITLELEDVIMVAHSVSGMVASLATIQHPELFSKMILVGASPRYLNDEAVGYVGGFDQPSLDGLYETMATNYFAWVSGFSAMAMENADRPELAQSFAKTLGDIRPDIAQSVARVIFQSDYRNVLNKLDKPVLLLQTKHDIAVPMDVANYLNKNIQGSKLHVVNAEGHFPHISAADEIVKEIKNFL